MRPLDENAVEEIDEQEIYGAFPIRTLQIERRGSPSQEVIAGAPPSVRKHPFLQLLDETQLNRLFEDARLLRFGRGEKVIVA